jgi:hypothetical protein
MQSHGAERLEKFRTPREKRGVKFAADLQHPTYHLKQEDEEEYRR